MRGVEYMAFYPRDWMEGTFDLTPEQRAYYIDLIAHIADTGNQLRDDDQYVAGLLRTNVRRWRRVKRELTELGKISSKHGHLINNRASAEVEKAWEYIETKRKAGRKGGRKRAANLVRETNKTKDLTPNSASSSASSNAPSGASGGAMKLRDKTRLDSPPISPPNEHSGESDSEFEAFWKLVPRKVGRGAAGKAFKGARKKASLEMLIAGIRRYATETAGKEVEFVKHPATWLRGECWLDEIGANATGSGSTDGGASPVWEHQDQLWRNRVRVHAERGSWEPEWGPEPREPGCQVPKEILDEFPGDDAPAAPAGP